MAKAPRCPKNESYVGKAIRQELGQVLDKKGVSLIIHETVECIKNDVENNQQAFQQHILLDMTMYKAEDDPMAIIGSILETLKKAVKGIDGKVQEIKIYKVNP